MSRVPVHEVAAAGAPTWTAQQAAAIGHGGGDLLVSAAAGSGKTAVLAERCARLVTADGPERTTVDRLLVLTFTEAAANEMRTRIAQAIREKIAAIQKAGRQPPTHLLRQVAMVERAAISTLHAFCARVLRTYFHEAQVDPAFDIIDADEAALLRDDVLAEVLARWHQLPADDADAGRFAAFYESHAQGREAALADFVRELHAMLASVKDPAAWLAAARGVYSEAGAPATREAYVGQVVRDLRMIVGRTERQVRELRGRGGCENLIEPLEGFRATLAEAAARLSAEGARGWDVAAAHVRAFEFPARIGGNPDVDGFDALKERTVGKGRKDLARLQTLTFAPRQTAEQLLRDLHACAGPLETLIRVTLDFQAAFRAAKQGQNRLDFADLERYTLELLTRPGSAAAADLRRKFDYLLVDEFQDINPLQAALLEAARSPVKHGGAGNLFVVGDVKQSIYAFRLAEPRLFLELEERLRGRTPAALVALQHNFRSAPALLAAMNTVFERLLTPAVAGLDYAAGHALHPPPGGGAEGGGVGAQGKASLSKRHQAPLPDGRVSESPVESGGTSSAGPIEFHVVVTDAAAEGEAEEETAGVELSALEQEARFVAERIAALLAENRQVRDKKCGVRPLAYRDIAILLRGVRNRAPFFTRALGEKNIPVHADLATGYFDAEEVRATLALLNVLDNPCQDVALAAVMLSPYGRFTPDDLARIRLAYPDKHAVAFHEAVHRYLLNEGGVDEEAGDLPGRLAGFFAKLDHYRARTRVLPLHEALAEIYQDSRILVYLAGVPGGAPQQRIANLQALHHRAQQFAGFRKQGLYRFLRFIERLRENDGDFGEAPVLSEASNVVRIMTVHKSKGLEFPVVFVATLGAKFSTDFGGPVAVSRDHYVGLQVADLERNVYLPTAASARNAAGALRAGRAEELRLLYVAMTRARDHLVLTGACAQGDLERARAMWAEHNGPLPEDVLLKGRCFLDYLLPLATAPDARGAFAFAAHEMGGVGGAVVAPVEEASPVLAGQPLTAAPARSAVVDALIHRLTAPYTHAALTALPALFSVTTLKKLVAPPGPDEDTAAELFLAHIDVPAAAGERAPLPRPVFVHDHAQPADLKSPIAAALEDPRTRGIVTHRCLQELDFAGVTDAASLDEHVNAMIARRLISADQGSLINRDDVLWFLGTHIGRELRDIAAPSAVRSSAQPSLFPAAPPAQLLRELPFTYVLSAEAVADLLALQGVAVPSLTSPFDRPLLRGVIDLLVVGPEAAWLLDYKTDAAVNVPAVLPGYQRQMNYYARAAAAILRRPVTHAVLVFLHARRLELVRMTA